MRVLRVKRTIGGNSNTKHVTCTPPAFTTPTSVPCDLPFARHTPPSNSRNPVVSAWARHPKSKSRSRGAELLRAVPCKGPHIPRLPRLRTANGLPDLLVRSSSARSKRTMAHIPMARGQVGYLRGHRAALLAGRESIH